MRARLFPSLILVALLLLAPTTPSSAANSAGWAVTNEPTRVVNGTPLLFRVKTPTPVRALSARWLDHDVVFSFDPADKSSTSTTGTAPTHTSWFALAGVSQETKPGTYSIALRAETSAGQTISSEKKILVVRQHYPRVLLKVPTRYTAPNLEDQRQIEQDKQTKADAFKTVSADREWRGSFTAPVDASISDVFGVERVFNGSVQSTHQGLDFRVPSGTSVAAVNNGRVILAQPLFFEGNCVVIDHGQGLLTLYLHLSKFAVKTGDEVKKGQPIGLSGGTGRATGPHLHLAVRWQGVYLN
ncbi:MAG: M23 family metallopeptidase, partial [Terriglobales bacterium]